MTTPDKPKPVASASVERPETDLDGLLDVFALDLEVRLKHVVDETKQGIDAAKLAETQANTGIGGETTPKQRLKRDVPRKKIERGGGETSSESGLIEAQALLREWSDIRLTAPDKGAFDAAVKTRLRIERLPNITTHQATVANLERRVRGEAVPGDDSVLSKNYDLQVWLPKYRAIVEAVRAVVAEMDVQSKPEAAPKKPERTDNQANLLTEQLARWDSLVAEIEKIGGKERLEQMIVKKLEEKRIGTMKWESLHQQVRKTLGEIQAGTSSKSTEKQQAFLAGNTTFYQGFLVLAERLRDELKTEHRVETKPSVPVVAAETVSVGAIAQERQQNQVERNKKRLEELQEIVTNFRVLYDDYFSSEDYPTNRRSYERQGEGDRTEARKIILPPIDEDERVVTDQRDLLKKGIHDIYADFLLVTTPEKLREKAEGKGIDGKHQFEAYKTYLMNLTNRLWAQIEAINGSKVLQSLDRQQDTRTRGRGEQLRSWGELKPEERGERAKSLEQWCISFWQNLKGELEEKGMENRKQQAALIRSAYEKKLTENIREKLSVHMTDEEMQSISRALEKVIARLQ